MRFYVHLESSPGRSEYTFIAKWSDPEGTILQLKVYTSQYPLEPPLEPTSLTLLTSKCVLNTVLLPDIRKKILSDSEKVMDVIDDKSDVFVVVNETEALKEEGNKLLEEKNYTAAIAKYSDAIVLDPTQIAFFSNRSQAYLGIGNFSAALSDAEKCILIDKTSVKAYFRKGTALLKLERFSEAKDFLSKAIATLALDSKTKPSFEKLLKDAKDKEDKTTSKQESTIDSTASPNYEFLQQAYALADQAEAKKNFRHAAAIYGKCLEVSQKDKKSILKLGNIWLNAKKYPLAIQYYKQGLGYYPEDYQFHLALGDAYYHSSSYTESSQFYCSALEKWQLSPSQDTTEDFIKVKIGNALYKAGAQGTAVKLWQAILDKNPEDPHALFSYGVALKTHSSPADALPVFLKLLVKDSENQMYREELCAVIRDPTGFTALQHELSTIPQSGSALAYIAMVVKEYGALEASATLYSQALELEPSSATYCLNLVHVYEMLYKQEKAFTVIKEFCQKNASLSVGPLTCAHMYNQIRSFSSTTHSDTNQSGEDLPTSSPPARPLDQMYNSEELDLLALFCTLVKILYIQGNLHLVTSLAKIINPVREGRPMHTTTIRNEHAYFCCIDQLMTYHQLPQHNAHPTAKNLPILYLSGDSHALVSAWQEIEFQGTKHLIKPLLVTGLKCWHLRPESNFYPKYNFWNVIPNAPSGSHVVFQFGEIDCREGFVLAVQKGIYENIEEGAKMAVDIYMQVLVEVQDKYNYHVYVHPPAPVIDVTREIVKTFTKVLKAETQKMSKKRAALGKTFYYLDFFEKLLTPEQDKLNPICELDGTHMNPKYLPYLEDALKLLPVHSNVQ